MDVGEEVVWDSRKNPTLRLTCTGYKKMEWHWTSEVSILPPEHLPLLGIIKLNGKIHSTEKHKLIIAFYVEALFWKKNLQYIYHFRCINNKASTLYMYRRYICIYIHIFIYMIVSQLRIHTFTLYIYMYVYIYDCFPTKDTYVRCIYT